MASRTASWRSSLSAQIAVAIASCSTMAHPPAHLTEHTLAMKAAFIKETGPPGNIQYGDLDKPTPGEGQVLVKVEAVDVNPVETEIRSGMVPMPLPNPFVVGCDLAGVVEAVGPKATRFKPGDRVWGSNQGLFGRQGTFAEYAAVGEEW